MSATRGKNSPTRKPSDFYETPPAVALSAMQTLYNYNPNILASIRRWENIYQYNPPLAIFQFVRRPSFTGDGNTNATEYAMFLWQVQRPHTKPTELLWISNSLTYAPPTFDR